MLFYFVLFSKLEKEEQIHSIDIGNEGSAFIEILVGNSSVVRDQDFEVSFKSNHHHVTKTSLPFYILVLNVFFFFLLGIRLFWLRLPLCHQRRVVMAPTWTAFVSLGQTSCRKAQHRRSGTGWKLCVLNLTTRSEQSHLNVFVKYLNICIWNVFNSGVHL